MGGIQSAKSPHPSPPPHLYFVWRKIKMREREYNGAMSATLLAPVGLAMLSWKSRRTLRATLESMRRAELFALFDDAVIYFQEMDDEDRALAGEFGMRAEGNDKNTGILRGMKAAAMTARCDYVLYVENDCRIADDIAPETAKTRINEALGYLLQGRADYCRMEKRKDGGGFKHLRYFPSDGSADTAARKLRRLLRPAKARRVSGGAVFVCDAPEDIFPRDIRRLGGGFWSVDSSAMNWSNRPVLYPREWFLREVVGYAESHPRSRTVNGFPDMEKELNCKWWRERGFRIGVGEGLFTHDRLDRPPGDEKQN